MTASDSTSEFVIKAAGEGEAALMLSFIRELAAFEKMTDEVVATEELLGETLFGERRYAEAVIGYAGEEPVGFALFFHNFSTFLAKPGIFLEDLFVRPTARGNGFGKALLAHVASIAKERDCGRLEWLVLDWNQPAIDFYESLGGVGLRHWIPFRLTGDALESFGGTSSSTS